MERVYRVIAIVLTVGSLAQICYGFSEYISELDVILSPNASLMNPTSFELFGKGLTGIASAAPTLLIAAIFYHMKPILGAISRNG